MTDPDRVTSRIDRKGRLRLNNVEAIKAGQLLAQYAPVIAEARTQCSLDETGAVEMTRLDLRITLLVGTPAAQTAMTILDLVAAANGKTTTEVVKRHRDFA